MSRAAPRVAEPDAAEAPGRLPDAAATVRVALLTPYSGGNLGDAAIQESAMRNIRRRAPRAVIAGITLDPERTALRHGIPCHPLNVRSVQTRPGSAPAAPSAGPPARRSGAAAFVKRIPILGPSLRAAVHAARAAWSFRREAGHVVRSYRFMRRQDLLLASGGGQIDDAWGGAWGHPWALFKFATLARMAGAKFAVVSVGVGELHSALSRWFVRRALRGAVYRSYRDPGSKTLLAGMAFTRDDPCVPDLALGLPWSPPLEREEKAEGVRRVGVSPIAYGHAAYWSTGMPDVHLRYMRQLALFVEWLMAAGNEVVLFATSNADRVLAREMLGAWPGKIVPPGRPGVREIGDGTLEGLLAPLSQVDCVVASRLHGVVLSHYLGKPTVAVSFERKVDAHMRDFGMERYVLDIHSVDRGALQQAFTAMTGEAGAVAAALVERRRQARVALDAQFDRVLRLVRRGGEPA
jgi:polysaccharide pyruvyl transferase WcaK-like protein